MCDAGQCPKEWDALVDWHALVAQYDAMYYEGHYQAISEAGLQFHTQQMHARQTQVNQFSAVLDAAMECEEECREAWGA